MIAKIINGEIPYGIYEGIIGSNILEIPGTKESALEDKLYTIELNDGIRGIDCPVLVKVKDDENYEKIVELIFKK